MSLDKFISQTGQDQWATVNTGRKRNGIYVDIGAHDGKLISNTHYLDHAMGWIGLCVEANPKSCAMIGNNRTARCIPVEAALYHTAGQELSFRDCSVGGGFESLQTHSFGKYGLINVKTQTIDTVLQKYLPIHKNIDFMTVDIEGAELDMLKKFPFNTYRIGTLVIGHNGDMIVREKMSEILTANGMVHTEDVSADAYYVHKDYDCNIGQFVTPGTTGGLPSVTHQRDLETPPEAAAFRECQFQAHKLTGHTHHLGRFTNGNGWLQDVRQHDRSILTTQAKEFR